jgi:hypothetical protein
MMQPMAPLIATAPSASDGYFEIVGVWSGSCRRSFARCGVDQRSDFRLVITEHLFASDPVGRLNLKLERLPTFRCGEVDGGAHGEGGQALVEPLTLVVVVGDFDNVKHPPFGGWGSRYRRRARAGTHSLAIKAFMAFWSSPGTWSGRQLGQMGVVSCHCMFVPMGRDGVTHFRLISSYTRRWSVRTTSPRAPCLSGIGLSPYVRTAAVPTAAMMPA